MLVYNPKQPSQTLYTIFSIITFNFDVETMPKRDLNIWPSFEFCVQILHFHIVIVPNLTMKCILFVLKF